MVRRCEGSRGDNKARGPLHLVSVWMQAKGITLAQVPTDAKSNEITAILQVLESNDMRGAVITIDSMRDPFGIVKAITERSGGAEVS